MKKINSFIIVYEIKVDDNGVEDEKPIFNCDSLNEAVIIFDKKWGVKTTHQNLSYSINNSSVIKEKYKIFKIKI